jgi:hypothetical protein
MGPRTLLAIFLMLAPQTYLVAQADSPPAAQETVAGQSIVGQHAYFIDLMLALAPYPMSLEEINLALRTFPVVEAWARTHPEQWSPNLAPANQIRHYLDMPLWQQARLEGPAILALQMKLALFGEVFALNLLERKALEQRIGALEETADNPESTSAERSAAVAGRKHIAEVLHAFTSVPKERLSFIANLPQKMRDLGQRALNLKGYKQLTSTLPLVFVQPGNGLRFFAPKEWSRASPANSALSIYQLMEPNILINFESYTLAENEVLDIEHLAAFASSFMERSAATELFDIGAPSSKAKIRHGFVNFVMGHPDSHFVVHSWQMGSEVFQLSFISSNTPWPQANIILQEILGLIEVGNTYQSLLADLPEIKIHFFADRQWKADVEPPLGSDARLSLANNTLTVSLSAVKGGGMEAVDLAVIESVYQQAAKDFEEVQLIENKVFGLSGNSAGYTEFTGVGAWNDNPVHMRVVVIFRGERAYILTIKSDPQDWAAALPATEELLRNMKFL